MLHIFHVLSLVAGAPPALEDTNNPDWAPNLNLGHSGFISNEPQAMKSMMRYERLLNRKNQTEDIVVVEALLQLSKKEFLNYSAIMEREAKIN